jgi:protein O-GlcNAc transferase
MIAGIIVARNKKAEVAAGGRARAQISSRDDRICGDVDDKCRDPELSRALARSLSPERAGMTEKSHFRFGRRGKPAKPRQSTKAPVPSAQSASAFVQALGLHRAGRLTEAEEIYRQILKAEPDHFDSLHLLGVVHHQRGDHAKAVRQIDTALRINPDVAHAHCNRGAALERLQSYDAAVASYDRALAIEPDLIEAFHSRGNALYALGRCEAAVASYDRAIALRPDHAEAFNNRGVALAALERFDEAIASYDRAIALKPDYAQAFNNRGNARNELTRFEAAIVDYEHAIARSPDYAEAFNNRGAALLELGRLDEALASCEKAIALKPDDANAFYNHGNVLQGLKRFGAAAATYDRAIMLEPSHVGAFINRGVTLHALGRIDEALVSYDRAIMLRPDHAEAFYNRGNALKEARRFGEAFVSYERAVALDPAHAEAFNNRGIVLAKLDRFDEATASYDRAIALDAGYAEAFNNRGNALQERRRFDLALASYDQAIALDAAYAEAFNNRGTVLQALQRFDAAIASYDRAIALRPDYADAFANRGAALQELLRFGEAAANYEQALAFAPDHKHAFGGLADCAIKACDWTRLRQSSGELRRHVIERRSCIHPFLLLGYSDDASLQWTCARNYVDDLLDRRHSRLPAAAWRNDRIKIAYLSSDFRRHAVAVAMAELFERHDRSRFEVIAVSFGPDDGSEMRARLIATFEQFIDARAMSDEEVAQLLDRMRIDIAMDLNGHTQGARAGILARRPAPIQATYIFPATTGAAFIDYIVADATVLPFDQQPHYSEAIVHLPDCYWVNDTKRTIASRTPTRQEVGLPANGFVFCCFNNNWKISPPIFAVWMRLLKSVEGSVMWLLRDNAEAASSLRKEASAVGIDPARLVFADRWPGDEHLARHRLADLFLDTLPYNAHTTASDALWSGLPVVTCRGQAFAARVAASMLHAVGLSELVTDRLEDYEAMALRLARDRELLGGFRERLARNRLSFPFFDTKRFVGHIEAAYTTMWKRWQRGERPRSFSVPPAPR